MSIEEKIAALESNVLKLAELAERSANTQQRIITIIDNLVTALQPTTRNENTTVQKEMQ
jgi:hypothetical protein